MRVLVTGSSGFVGSHLCHYLRTQGDDAIGFPGPNGPAALDVTNAQAVLQVVADSKPDAIVHLGGVSSVAWSHSNPIETFITNCLGTVNILQGVRATAPNCVILVIGSGEMYGKLARRRLVSETHRLDPLSPYAASKCAAEVASRQFAGAYGLRVICARPFNHLGPGQSPQFVAPSFARQIAEIKLGKRPPLIKVGDLSAVRDFTHVADVVHSYRLLLERGRTSEAYNICTGVPFAIHALLDRMLALASVTAQIEIDPSRLRVLSRSHGLSVITRNQTPWLGAKALDRRSPFGSHRRRLGAVYCKHLI